MIVEQRTKAVGTARVTTAVRDSALSVDEVVALVSAPSAGGIGRASCRERV